MTEQAQRADPHSVEHPGEESRAAVLAAMAANFLIACGKCAAAALTGSAAMFAEAAHSVADTVNQVFLLIGINLSHTKSDDSHPLGYGKETFFWSFLAAIFIFVAGAAFSFYEGVRTLDPRGGARTQLVRSRCCLWCAGDGVVVRIGFIQRGNPQPAPRSAAQRLEHWALHPPLAGPHAEDRLLRGQRCHHGAVARRRRLNAIGANPRPGLGRHRVRFHRLP